MDVEAPGRVREGCDCYGCVSSELKGRLPLSRVRERPVGLSERSGERPIRMGWGVRAASAPSSCPDVDQQPQVRVVRFI